MRKPPPKPPAPKKYTTPLSHFLDQLYQDWHTIDDTNKERWERLHAR